MLIGIDFWPRPQLFVKFTSVLSVENFSRPQKLNPFWTGGENPRNDETNR